MDGIDDKADIETALLEAFATITRRLERVDIREWIVLLVSFVQMY